jgi:hypothetical protein
MTPEEFGELLTGSGFKSSSVSAATEIVQALTTLGAIRAGSWSDGIGWEIRCALEELTAFRRGLHIHVGERVTIRGDSIDAEVERWHRLEESSTVETFSEAATVLDISYSARNDLWYATIIFDHEYSIDYTTKTLKEVKEKDRHTWMIQLPRLTVAKEIQHASSSSP